jgi:hypothetical protein
MAEAAQPKSRPEWQTALALTLALRVFYSATAAALSFILHPSPLLIHSNVLTDNLPAPGTWHYALLGVWQRYDTLWYLHIAERGYDLAPSVVFYPLYPAMIRLVTPLAGPIASALIVSTIAAFFFFWGMIRLARAEFPHTSVSRTLALTAVWPASFFLFAGYTEALAVTLVVWCIVFARHQHWIASTLCAIAAGLTRSMGTVLIVPLIILAWRSRRASAWLILLAPIGTLSYWAWLRQTGHLDIAEAYRMFWTTQVAPPWTTLWRAALSMAHHPDISLTINFLALVLFAAAGAIAHRRLEDRCFTAAVILQILLRVCNPPLLGIPRYLLPAYPAFLKMGDWLQHMPRQRFATVCAALFLLNLVWMTEFFRWSLVL